MSYDEGMKTRREVLGDEHVDRSIERTTEFTADFQDLITRYAWGDVWSRPGLDRRTRSLLTLALLTALGHEKELATALTTALDSGEPAVVVAKASLKPPRSTSPRWYRRGQPAPSA